VIQEEKKRRTREAGEKRGRKPANTSFLSFLKNCVREGKNKEKKEKKERREKGRGGVKSLLTSLNSDSVKENRGKARGRSSTSGKKKDLERGEGRKRGKKPAFSPLFPSHSFFHFLAYGGEEERKEGRTAHLHHSLPLTR